MPWVDSDLKRFLVPGPRPHCGLLLWRSLRHHHPQVLPGPPQRSHGEEPHSLQPRRPLPHHLLHQPQPPADGARQHPGPLAAQAQLHSLQPGQPSLHRAYEFLPDGPAASEVLSRQDGHGASSPLLCAAREGAGTVPPPHRPVSACPPFIYAVKKRTHGAPALGQACTAHRLRNEPPLCPKKKWHLLRLAPENLKTYQTFPSGKRVSPQERKKRDCYFEFRA
nr:protein FAM166C isoform X3 [Pan troglodytes]